MAWVATMAFARLSWHCSPATFLHPTRSWLSSLAKCWAHCTLACLASGPGRAPSRWDHGICMHGWSLIWAANRLLQKQLWSINGKPNLGNTWGGTDWLYIYMSVHAYLYIYIHIVNGFRYQTCSCNRPTQWVVVAVHPGDVQQRRPFCLVTERSGS